MRKVKVLMAGESLFPAAWEATGYFERLRGLSKSEGVTAQAAMLFARCPRVQCWSMKFPIDVAMMDRDGRVLAVDTVEPGKAGPKAKGAYWALECRAGRLAELGVAKGCVLEIEQEGGAR